MCFLFNNVHFLFLLLFIINVKSDDDRVAQNKNRSEKFRRKFVNNFNTQPETNFRNNLPYETSVAEESVGILSGHMQHAVNASKPSLQYDSIKDWNQSGVNRSINEKINSDNEINVTKHANNDIHKTPNDTSRPSTINDSREIARNKGDSKSNSNELYYEILQTKPNTTVWSKFEFLIKPFVDDKIKVEESNGIIISKRKNLTFPNNSSVLVNKSKNISSESGNSSSDNSDSKNLTVESKTLVRTERNATDGVNITDRHFNSHNKFNQDSWTQVSTLESNKDQIDRFKYPTLENTSVQNKYSSIKPAENLNKVPTIVTDKISADFNSLKRHTLAALHNKFGNSAQSNIHSPSQNYYTSDSLVPHSTVSSSSVTAISSLQKPFESTVTLPTNSKNHFTNYQSVTTKAPNENQKQIPSSFGHVVSTTHKSWINNNLNKQSANDYYSAIITAADAIKKKHKPVSSTQTVLFPLYDDELETPVLISSTKKPIQLSSTTNRPVYASSTKKPFKPVITLTKKPDLEYQSEVNEEEEEEEEEENEELEAQPDQEDVEYEETTTQLPATKKPSKPLFVSSTATPVYTKRPYIIRPVINVISQPVSSTRKPILPYRPPSTTSTTTTTTTTQPPPTTEKQLTTALVTVPPSTSSIDTDESEDEDEDDSDDSDASEERKRRRKPPYPYLTHPQQHYPLIQSMSSPAPYLVYQQPIQQVEEQEEDIKNNDSSDDDEDDDDGFFVNPLDDDEDDDDDEILEETVEVHKSPHGHIYPDYPLLSKKKKKKLFKKKKHGFKLKDFKKLKKFMLPLLLAYKLKFFVMVPLLLGGLVLIVGTTGFAGFFFALFAVGLGLRSHK